MTLLLLLIGSLTGGSGLLQVGDTIETPAPPDTVGQEESVGPPPSLEARSWSSLAGVTFAFPRGYADDPEGGEGSAWLLARTLEEEGGRRLAPLASELRVTMEAGRTLVTVLAPPESWDRTLDVVEGTLFRTPLPTSAVEAARGRILDRLGFEEGAPVRDFEVEKWRHLLGLAHPWARPPEGSRNQLQERTPAELMEARERILRRDEARASVVGRSSLEEVPPWLRPMLERSGSEPGSTPRLLWDEESRHVVDRDVTSTWISAAFPAPDEVSRTALEFLAHTLHERLTPSPPDPGLFTLEVRVADLPEGRVILFRAAVDPRTTLRWEERIGEAVSSVAENQEQEAFFLLRRRRFRSDVAHRLAHPEEALERRALDLLTDGDIRNVEEEIWELTQESIRDAAEALGPPRLLLFGPGAMFGEG